jgi:hypothetical protein
MASIKAMLLSIIWVYMFQSDIPFVAVDRAFNAKNSSEIVAISKDKILLSIEGKEGAYSHQQAIMVLKDFFTKHADATFKYTFKGKASSDGTFAIGTFENKTDHFRITIQFKKIGSEFKIERLTIEKL